MLTSKDDNSIDVIRTAAAGLRKVYFLQQERVVRDNQNKLESAKYTVYWAI